MSRGRFHVRRFNDFGSAFAPYFFPDDESFEYEQPYVEAAMTESVPEIVIVHTDEQQSRAPVTAAAKPQVIDIPAVPNAAAAKPLPATLFIFVNGERLEARRFVLTVSDLRVTVDRQQRTIPLAMLDISGTVAANRQRGIDLRIPAKQNEIFLGF